MILEKWCVLQLCKTACGLYASFLPPQHGRVKVRSSKEVEEAKRRAVAEKVKKYREITEQIYSKVRTEVKCMIERH